MSIMLDAGGVRSEINSKQPQAPCPKPHLAVGSYRKIFSKQDFLAMKFTTKHDLYW
jgi:hypothetical protein